MDRDEDTPRLTTFTLTDHERNVIARCLTMAVTLLDALNEREDTRLVMELWERIAPETIG